MKSEAYLEKIRLSPGLKRAVLSKLTVEGRKVTFHLVTDLTYRAEDIAYARDVSRQFVPQGCEADVTVFKSVPSEEGVRAAIASILRTRFPAASAFLAPGDAEIAIDERGGRFVLPVGEEERVRFSAGDVVNELSAALSRRFCGSWMGDVRYVRAEGREISREAPPPEEFLVPPRVFPIENYAAIDGAAPKTALYIADLKGEMQNVTLCGVIQRLEERVTKNNKPYFRLSIADGSGQAQASYFTKKATLEKVRALKEGDSVCLTGNYELYNGSLSFTAKQIDCGTPPAGFVPVARPSRPVPARYLSVFPEPAADLVQSDFFGGKPLPAFFLSRDYVVFDLETTGLNHTPAGGVMDRIIEIGAVKIHEGRIAEKFSSFVACPVRLSGEIVDLTGITDDMLAGAPEIGSVIADFFKFCDGASLVAHNIAFDSGFIRYYGEQEGFFFDQPLYDTVALAQSVLVLNNYKLNTVADHYGFSFHHHRAFDDAFVTAKIFIELVREKGELPEFRRS